MKLFCCFSLLFAIALGAVDAVPAPPNNSDSWSHIELASVAHGADGFVVIGNEKNGVASLVYVSDDGRGWRLAESMSSEELSDVIWDKTRYLAVAVRGEFYTSPNGLNWSTVGNAEMARAEIVSGVAARGDGYLITCFSGVLHSNDLVTWETLLEGYEKFPFLVIAGDSNSQETLLANTEGSAWSISDEHRTTKIGGDKWSISAALWSDAQRVAVGLDGTIRTATDSFGWKPIFAADESLMGIATDGNTVVAVGGNGAIFSDHGGSTWSRVDSPVSIDLIDIVWGDGRFVAIGAPRYTTTHYITRVTDEDGSTILFSDDGIRWGIGQVGPYRENEAQ